jgi:hypothetical protein
MSMRMWHKLCQTEALNIQRVPNFIDEVDDDFNIEGIFEEWYNLKDERLWMGVELFTPGERIFMCTQGGYIFEKEKETHDENHKEDNTIHLFCIKETSQ